MAHQPRVHRGTVYGAKHQKGMTLPAISPQRSPTPEQRTARVERERTPQQHSTSRADALAQLVARLTDAARYRIVRSEWKGEASPHFDMLAPRLQVCILGDWIQDVVMRLPDAAAPSDCQGIAFWKDCACHAVLKSLHALIQEEIHDGTNEWRLTAVALYEASTNGARAPFVEAS